MNTADFRQLITSHPEILDNPKVFAAFLRDVYPTEKGSVNLMITAFNAGVVSILRSGVPASLLSARITSLLMDDYSIAEEKARWAADLWINAYAVNGESEHPTQHPQISVQKPKTVTVPIQKATSNNASVPGKQISDFFTKVVGVTHNNLGSNTENRQDIIRDLLRKGLLNPGQALTLELDSDNRFSENAVKVIAPDGRQLGFLSQSVADSTAPKMRDGFDFQVSVSQVTGGAVGYSYGVNIHIIVFESVQLSQSVMSKSPKQPSKQNLKNLILSATHEDNPQYFQMTITEFGGAITKYVGPKTGDIVIPSVINGIQIVEIGNTAFNGCTGLTNLTIPDSITIIGNSAFKGCTNLIVHVLSGSYAEKYAQIKQIPYQVIAAPVPPAPVLLQETDLSNFIVVVVSADSGCRIARYIGAQDSQIVIPRKKDNTAITEIGGQAFNNCIFLRSVIILDGITRILEGAFKGCTSLSKIIIPESVTEIGYHTFDNCSKLVIHTPKYSYAERYAKQNNIRFQTIAPTQFAIPKNQTTKKLSPQKQSTSYARNNFSSSSDTVPRQCYDDSDCGPDSLGDAWNDFYGFGEDDGLD